MSTSAAYRVGGVKCVCGHPVLFHVEGRRRCRFRTDTGVRCHCYHVETWNR